MTATLALRIAGRLAAGVALLVPAGLYALLCLFASGMQCDDSCEAFSPAEAARHGVPWHETAGAWQWSAIGWLGFATFACAVACAGVLAAGRARLAAAFFALTVVVGLVPWIIAQT
jgi:hypothetical protein